MSRQSEWKKRNRPAMNAYRRKWMKAHPEKRKEYGKQERANHSEIMNAYRREWRLKNPDYDRIYTRKIRQEALDHYGSVCQCCGEFRYEFLAIDHKNGGGLKQRRELGKEGQKFVFWLRKNNYPEGYQVLCHNCNLALGHYGFCPHRPEIKRPILRGKRKYAINSLRTPC
jgi:hypothetical protein